MAGYLVYLPGIHGAELTRRLQSVGLECLADGNTHTIEARECAQGGRLGGPDNGLGVLVRWFDFHKPEHETPFRYEPDQQTWTAAKPDPERKLEAGRYWLGRWSDRPITPEALARPKQYPGCAEKLLDGNEWLMPIARALPRNLALDDNGQLQRIVKPSMADYFEASERFFKQYLDNEHEQMTLQGCWSFAARGLSMNYYLNAEVISWLGLLDDEALMRVVGASFEYRKLLELGREIQKKTARTEVTPAGSSGTPGQEG